MPWKKIATGLYWIAGILFMAVIAGLVALCPTVLLKEMSPIFILHLGCGMIGVFIVSTCLAIIGVKIDPRLQP